MRQWILVLYEISRRMKSKDDSIIISSSELGISLGISQQSASRYLLDLEKRNFILRRMSNEGQEIRLTPEGFDLLHGLYVTLKDFFEGRKGTPHVLEGSVITGIGEGAYYIREYGERIKEALGFKPFPGTLNVKLKDPQNPERHATGIIKGFRKNGRTFGDVKFMPVKLIFKEKSTNCHLILPKRTHYRDIVEIISESNLRKELGINDGDDIRIDLTA